MSPPSSNKSGSRNNMDRDFTLLSPHIFVDPDDELFLKYGDHCNRVLFVDYGFVIPLDFSAESKRVYEVNVDDILEDLIMEKGPVGTWMKEILQSEDYWRDWTMHFASGSAFPSYRLITAVRLFSIFPAGSIPPLSEKMLGPWKDVVLGLQEELSADCEVAWRDVLRRICTIVMNRASRALVNPALADTDHRDSIVALWAEERYIAERILEQTRIGEVF